MQGVHRRHFLAGMAGVAGLSLPASQRAIAAGLTLDPGLPKGLPDVAKLEALPGKKPLIKLAYRPPNYETPIDYFKTPFTPNDAFFVRYHLAVIPEIDAATWRLKIGGEGIASPLELSLADLKAFEPVEINAVCQCSGNRRGLFEPHVPGVEWGVGAMGNAKWKGARLKDILARAGVKENVKEIVLNGADSAVLDQTPDFVKSLPIGKAMEETVLVAYEMNGEPLPHWNGFPARIIVPGWTATYWMKHIVDITAVNQPFDGFWMKSAYRIPAGAFPLTSRFPTQETAANTPITEMVVNSLIVSPAQGTHIKAGSAVEMSGIAWDGGHGINAVEVSSDGGRTFAEAKLGEDHGRFAFRPWSHRFTAPKKKGPLEVMASARNAIGQTQVSKLILNPAGYHHNVISKLSLEIV